MKRLTAYHNSHIKVATTKKILQTGRRSNGFAIKMQFETPARNKNPRNEFLKKYKKKMFASTIRGLSSVSSLRRPYTGLPNYQEGSC